MSHAEAVERFYAAFGRRDHRAMADAYAPGARFSDPVFPDLAAAQIGAMWRMLCERATDLRIECGPISTDADTATAEWQAWYTYTATGRPVHNRISATFDFSGNLIRRHRDEFDLYRWARHALGAKGVLLGWTPMVQAAIRAQARRSLDTYKAQISQIGNDMTQI